jgi:hypothetical protein
MVQIIRTQPGTEDREDHRRWADKVRTGAPNQWGARFQVTIFAVHVNTKRGGELGGDIE